MESHGSRSSRTISNTRTIENRLTRFYNFWSILICLKDLVVISIKWIDIRDRLIEFQKKKTKITPTRFGYFEACRIRW